MQDTVSAEFVVPCVSVSVQFVCMCLNQVYLQFPTMKKNSKLKLFFAK